MTRGAAASEVYNPSTGLWDPPATIPAAAASGGPLRSYFTYDLLGRQLSQSDSDAAGSTIVYSSSTTYNRIGYRDGRARDRGAHVRFVGQGRSRWRLAVGGRLNRLQFAEEGAG